MNPEDMPFKRSESIKKIPQKTVDALEDKQFDLIETGYHQAWKAYAQKRFWPLFLGLSFSWLILPYFGWKWWRHHLPEWQQVQRLEIELEALHQKRSQRSLWRKIWNKPKLPRRDPLQEVINFYRTLTQSVRQYNIRVDLYDYTLDRQNKHLDPPFTVGELEQIELTFQRIYDELRSAIRLLEVAEQNPDMDLVTLLKDQYAGLLSSADYLTQTTEIGNSGRLIHELLVLETELRKDIVELTEPSARLL